MTIPFTNLPANIREPLFYAELDNSRANSGGLNQRALIIGQKLASGTGVANVPVLSQGVADAATVGGAGSMLHLMTQAYRLADSFGELWYLPLADNGAAVAAVGSINFTAAPTAAGTINLYIGGVRISLAVVTSQTGAQIATALVAAIAKVPLLAVSAAVDGTTTSKVNFTALNAGPAGNDIDLQLNYQGTRGGESTPAGLTFTIVAMASGATAPVLTTGLANLVDQAFDFIVCPYTDSTSLDALKTFLSDSSGRWSPLKMIYGHVFAAQRGSSAALVTAIGAGARNNPHESIVGFNNSPTPNWLWSAALAGTAAVSLRNDPAQPLQTLALAGVLAPPLASRFDISTRNTLDYNGVSTYTVDDDGTVRISNLITTYQQNSSGQPDDSYLEVETLFTLAYVLRFLRTRITSKFARVKLAADGTRFAAGAAIVTPNLIRADQIAAYQELESLGLVQNSDAFAANLIVQKNATNPNRVDVLWPGTLINQLRIFALLAQFRLS